MTKRVALNVSLTQELADFIRAEVASGQYGTASEVVRTSLRLLAKTQGTGRHRSLTEDSSDARNV